MSEPENINTAPPPGDITQVVEHLFRHESGKMISALTRVFGPANLQMAEDVVQEALLRALRTWPYYGVPQNPAGWIMQVAKNHAFDLVRREKRFRDKEPDIAALKVVQEYSATDAAVHLSQEFTDDRLRMMFVCCHPVIAPESQIALALKTLCGFGVQEIAAAFLTNDATIAKRLTRAKQKIREAKIAFEIPPAAELADRLDAVLHTLYLLFNEGYKASTGEKLVRADLCHEAIRLGELLVSHPAGDFPKTHALLALMLMSAARLPARTDDDGNLLRLRDQDRTQWNAQLIARGMLHFAKSAQGEEFTEYHIEAAIAACHCTAASYEGTDWQRIVVLYDQLLQFEARPLVALNRAIALAEAEGPQAGLDALSSMHNAKDLHGYYLYHATLGEFYCQLNQHDTAMRHFAHALELTQLRSEQKFLRARMEVCNAAVAANTAVETAAKLVCSQ